ncbi:hypothetical protein [Methanobrevibacter arboriphilus]|uniref:hypothetical protein n=1 Tax=Methanobrevibacter arboriphilus TaxID=39441 RepID=UPI001CDAEFAA|nr:hypothetical protein [Methanobrevibacter arboriphilus]
MKNILIRAGKDYFTNISPEATLSFRNRSTFGHNVGFYLISDSVYKLISTPNTSITPDSYLIGSRQSYKKNVAETINNEFDAFVLPVADFFKTKTNWTYEKINFVDKKFGDSYMCIRARNRC